MKASTMTVITIKDAEKMLERYGELKRLIAEEQEIVRELSAEKYTMVDNLLRAPTHDAVKVKGGEWEDPVYKTVEKMMDVYEARIKKVMERMLVECAEYDELRLVMNMAGITEREQSYIEMRYVKRMKLSDISTKMCYSERQLMRLRKSSVDRLVEWQMRKGS